MAASYPSSAKTFATISNGQASDAVQINGVYDEVTAVEQGLLAGLQHTFKPLTTGLYDLGTSVLRWKDLWLSGNANVGGALTTTGVSSLNGGATVTSAFKLASFDTATGAGLPTGNTNDLAVAATTTVLAISATTGSPVLTGIANGAAGRVLYLINYGAIAIALGHATTSTAANQFICPGLANVSVRAGGGVLVIYDGPNSRWRVVEP